MNKEQQILPELRFPEFENEGKWEITTIGEMGDFYYGKSAPKWSLSEDAPTLCVRYGELYTKFGTIIKEINSRTNIDPKTLRFSKGGEILVPRVGEDPFAFSNCSYLPFPNIAIGEMISVYETEQDSIFYAYYFNTLSSQFAKVVEGQNVKNLYYVNLEPIKIGKPKSLKEQQKIASCLASLDEVINSETEKLNLLQDHKKGLLQNLFPQQGETQPKYRFPEFENDGDWVIKKLSKLGKIINGLTYKPNDVQDNGLLVLRSSNVQDGQIVLDDCVFVNPDIKGANISRPNDILICVRNGSKQLIGKNAILPEGLPKSTHGAFMTMFRAIDPIFVYQLFQTESYGNQVKADLGATINSINTKNFIKYEFAVPSNPKEQLKIANFLSSVDDLIEAQSQRIKDLQNHKKGLLQQLFPNINDAAV